MIRPGDRLVVAVAGIPAAAWVGGAVTALCSVAPEIGGVDGASVLLLTGAVPAGSLCTTDGVAGLLDDLQFGLGEGPGIDAHLSGLSCAEPDLRRADGSRWPAFGRGARDAGAMAVFAFPLRLGAARLGALGMWRSQPGPLGDQEDADARLLAQLLARAVLSDQASRDGGSPGDLGPDTDFHLVVHQAAGMVAQQLGVGVAEALVRLRARSFGSGQGLTSLAADVVARKVRFASGDDGWGGDDPAVVN